MTKFHSIFKEIISQWDIYIPWGLFLYCYINLYFFYYQLSILIVFPFIIKFYKEKYFIKNYLTYSKKTKTNCILFAFVSLYCLVFILGLPFFKNNMIAETIYEKNTFYSCSYLNKESNEQLIDDFNNWQNKRASFGFPTNLKILINQISDCHLKNKTAFLSYVLLNPRYFTMGYNNSFVALPIKHALISLYGKPLPIFEKFFPDNKNGVIIDENKFSQSLEDIKKEIDSLN